MNVTTPEVFHLFYVTGDHWGAEIPEHPDRLAGTFVSEQSALDHATKDYGEQSNLDNNNPDWYIETGPFGWGKRLPNRKET